MKKIIILITLFISLTTQVLAEKRYVTDRILLGIHTEADEASKLIKSVPSGTELEVLDTAKGFVKIKLDDGTEGWVSSGFIMKETPATRKYDVLSHQYEQTTQALDKLKVDFEKNKRKLQVRRDQLSNATTTIRELKKRKKGGTVVADPETEIKLAAALEEVEVLKVKITELEKKPEPKIDLDSKKIFEELKKVKDQNETMKQSIEVALAHLKGESIPTAEELASIRPQFPTWYWSLLAIILLLGVIVGYFIMDYRFRRRHGGFRI
ncbi:MAG: TIGR04211 family SH3 domain-containing protein [Gammaproteobacteria bacterium]|nr:TIGR04211 family SH3 domain-containing protein [Gammaproteobacteria bacterium]